MIRSSTATWQGPGMTGEGRISMESNALDHVVFNFESRFAEGGGFSPEELLAAAHASDFTMKLAFVLGEAGYVPEMLKTTARVHFANGMIAGSHLVVVARIAGIPSKFFYDSVAEADRCCPMTRALSVKVSYEATIET